ncbi:MAG: MBL fold metallo-hydrolase [Candidatus Cloacimonetes bacterium]|nr:MBL fold metallo-hydrolase [Candidatus Cloacimonadota bacterium]
MKIVKNLKLGDFELFFLRDGSFWLDGGGYFGIVPKIIWEKLVYVDEFNRVKLNSNPLLVRTGKQNVLIDPGLGNKYSEKQKNIFKIDYEPSIAQSLAEIGMNPDDIDVVVATHLHFDHMGACTKYDNGKIVPTFKNAIHYVQKGEWEDATHPNQRTKGTYYLENYVPLMDAGLVKLVEGNVEIIPGFSVEVTGGHTRHHQIVFAKSNGKIAVYFGGILPAVTHLKIPYTMGFDLYPVEVMERRRELYQRAVKENWLVCLEHDPESRAGYIRQLADGKNYCFDSKVKQENCN